MKLAFSLFAYSFISTAHAGTAVVPMIHGQGVDDAQILNITRLIADEVDYHNKYSDVTVLSSKDSKITPECLRSTRCVYKHAQKK